MFYGGEVKGESAMEYFDDIGTRVVHTYQVPNYRIEPLPGNYMKIFTI